MPVGQADSSLQPERITADRQRIIPIQTPESQASAWPSWSNGQRYVLNEGLCCTEVPQAAGRRRKTRTRGGRAEPCEVWSGAARLRVCIRGEAIRPTAASSITTTNDGHTQQSPCSGRASFVPQLSSLRLHPVVVCLASIFCPAGIFFGWATCGVIKNCSPNPLATVTTKS